MGKLDQFYARLPVWAQHAAISTYGVYWYWLRFGPGFHQDLQMFLARERYSQSEWQNWQDDQLKTLLWQSTKIPYYQAQWGKSEIKAAQAGILTEIPLLDKEPIRANPFAFLRPDIHPAKRLIFHTSGSTGTPIKTIWTVQELRRSMAVREARSTGWAKVSFKMPRSTFSGRTVEPNPTSHGPFYRFNAIEKQVYLSPFHLREDTAHLYVRAIARHHVRWLTGYSVSYYLLAKLMLEQKLRIPHLDAVITTSEKVTSEMRQVMEQAYDCKVYEEYSTVENAIFASECSFGRLHVSPDVAVVEILRPDGTACDPGEVGEVVTTTLLRSYQTLIRYRLGDMAMWDPDPCPCGVQMPVIKEVLGRIEDVVVGPDGRQMVRFHGVFVNQPYIREGQIIQEALKLIRVKVVPTPGFGPDDIQEIIHRVQQRLSPEVEVVVEVVDHIPRMKSGKFQAVVSRLRQ